MSQLESLLSSIAALPKPLPSAAKPGAKYGRLTLLEELPRGEIVVFGGPGAPHRSRLGPRMWRCRCDCGLEVVRPHNRLAYGKVRSCGCLRSEIAIARYAERRELPAPDHTRIGGLHEETLRGSWLVLREIPAEGSTARERYWLCMCTCGTIALVRADRLAANPTADERKDARLEARRLAEVNSPPNKDSLPRGKSHCGCKSIPLAEHEFSQAEQKIKATRRAAEIRAEKSKALIEQYGLDTDELTKLRAYVRNPPRD